MSDRERWIIYPLLFAALSFGVRERYAQPDTIRYRSIECNELTIKSLRNQPQISLTANNAAGAVVLYANNRPALRLRSNGAGGTLEAMNIKGSAVAAIGASLDGGVVKLHGEGEKPTILVGHDRELEVGGLVAVDNRDDLIEQAGDSASNVWGLPLANQPPAADQSNSEATETSTVEEAATAREQQEQPTD